VTAQFLDTDVDLQLSPNSRLTLKGLEDKINYRVFGSSFIPLFHMHLLYISMQDILQHPRGQHKLYLVIVEMSPYMQLFVFRKLSKVQVVGNRKQSRFVDIRNNANCHMSNEQ
jgi:hypothetical protein